MASGRIAVLVVLSSFVTAQSSSGCTSSDVTKKLTSCLQGFTAALVGGDVCGSWNTFACCMTNNFASCDDALKKSVADKITLQRKVFGSINPNLKSCPANCAGGGSSPVSQPTKVEQIFNALIDLNDPTTFTVQKFIDAVKIATGVTDVPVAVVKAFEIIVQYTVPHAATMAQLKTAVAIGNNVQESQITVSESARRRLETQEGSAPSQKDMDVIITIDGSIDPVVAAAKAKAVKASAGTPTAAALKSALGGDVTVKTQPQAKAKVETKVKAEASQSAQIKSAISSKAVGTAVGGTITVPTTQSPVLPPETISAASTFTAALALVMIIAQAEMLPSF